MPGNTNKQFATMSRSRVTCIGSYKTKVQCAFAFRSPARVVLRHVVAALLGFVLAFPAVAQQGAGAAKVQRLLDLASAGEEVQNEGTSLPSRDSGSGRPDDVSYDLRQKPSAPAQVNLTTTVETRVENRTTNHGGGGVTPVTGGAPAQPPANSRDATSGINAAEDFRAVVAQSLGRELPVFGEDLFSSESQLAGADPLTVPADYRIGPGDEVLIRAWGQISIDFQGPVSRSGTVFLTGIGDIVLAGMRLDEARAMLHSIVATQYKDFELVVSLAKLRDIQVYLAGFVESPGVHTVPSTATALQGLLASGGPGDGADLRRIQVKRAGSVVATFDTYRFLVDGDKSADPQLLPGDVIHLPPAKGLVAIAGSVHRPAIYHLADNMTLRQLLELAGGSTVVADPTDTRIERFEGGRRSVVEVEGSPARSELPLRNGDLVMLVPASPQFDGSVTVTGHVAVPLRQAWRAGLTVSDLLPDAEALAPHADSAARNARTPLDGVGTHRDGGALPPRTREVNWDHAAIQRVSARTQATTVIAFNLAAALATPHGTADPVLQPGDTIVIYAKDDFSQPGRKRTRLVRIDGEVAVPGVYSMEIDATLQDLIARAGGVTSEAYLYGTVFSRASAREEEARRLRQAVDQIEEDYYRFHATRSRDVLAEGDAMVADSEEDATRALINRLRAAKPVGRVVLALDGPVSRANQLPEVTLEDGDTVHIPGRAQTVTLAGAIFQQGTLLWRKGDSAGDYILRSGGIRKHADRSEIVVIHADGTVRPLRRARSIQTGDSILVPEDVGQTSFGRKLRDWTTMLYQMAIGAAALKVIQN